MNITIYTCEDTLEAMMSCIYTAWAGKKGHKNIRLELEPVAQYQMFCDYVHVDSDEEKAEKVVAAIQKKISCLAFRQVCQAAASTEEDRLDVIYRFLLLGFAYGAQVTRMLSYKEVIRMMELSRKVGNEVHYFHEFTRFHKINENIYISHIEPKSNVTAMIAEHFADRMPSENWMIIDDNRRISVIHPREAMYYLKELTEQEMQRLKESEKVTDEFTEMWKDFFTTIGIEKRKNAKCQRTMLPLWYRKHMTEFL